MATEATDDILANDSAEASALREVLLECIHPEPSITTAHLKVVERDFVVDGTQDTSSLLRARVGWKRSA